MKFDSHKPIVFALSAAIPDSYRQAARDGVLYWNKALGRPLLQVIDAPDNVRAPSPQYNVIQWLTDRDFASTSHIQGDPLTGEILHAHIFVLSRSLMQGDLDEQNDHVRYLVAHEVGHALGLRHNFAKGPVSTVMNYFTKRSISIEKLCATFTSDLDLDTLPTLCTDGQTRCDPFELNSAELPHGTTDD